MNTHWASFIHLLKVTGLRLMLFFPVSPKLKGNFLMWLSSEEWVCTWNIPITLFSFPLKGHQALTYPREILDARITFLEPVSLNFPNISTVREFPWLDQQNRFGFHKMDKGMPIDWWLRNLTKASQYSIALYWKCWQVLYGRVSLTPKTCTKLYYI